MLLEAEFGVKSLQTRHHFVFIYNMFFSCSSFLVLNITEETIWLKLDRGTELLEILTISQENA